MLKLYNSLTNKKEVFKPIRSDQVTMYSCGPTVYDRVHIGNLRAFLLPDLLQRVLRHTEGYDVAWVMNITDIDDKMIGRLRQDYKDEPPNEALNKLADKYTDFFINDIEEVGIERCDIAKLPRATTFIPEMQQLIKQLLDDDLAYIADGSIYFSLQRYQDSGHKYGRLINIDYDGRARVIDDQDQKEGVGDFALWKAHKPGEPVWDFEIDGQNYPGRPGWHIECSVLSMSFLGKPFDIHTGGVDLRFPHHENELAQCGGVQANYYLHNEHVHVEGEKMAKSAGNFITAETLSDPMAYRYLCLQSHYRSQMVFSQTALQQAGERLKNLRKYADQLVLAKPGQLPKQDDSGNTKEFIKKFEASLRDDLNSAEALAAFSLIEGKSYAEETLKAIHKADDVLGLKLVNNDPIEDIIRQLVEKYEVARKNKDFTDSDNVRKQLNDDHNIGVSDTELGSLIHRMQF